MEITRGKIPSAKKVVVYGPEGIGKSTFASHFPDPLYIDTEGSTKDMDVARLPEVSSWQMIMEEIEYVKTHPGVCKTLVIDTIDWAEQLCVEYICAKHRKSGIEDFGYGNGYVYTKEEFGRFLNKLEELVKTGVHVVLTAHAQIRKFEQPDELGAYDRYELKLGKKTSSQTSPIVKEWADMVLFANYKTFAVSVDDKGKKHKGQGGSRVMYTSHHPCWDAKNRYGLPDEVPFDFSSIAHIINGSTGTVKPVPVQKENRPEQSEQVPKEESKNPSIGDQQKNDLQSGEQMSLPINPPEPSGVYTGVWESDPKNIPKALLDLMQMNSVTEWDIQMAVSGRGYYPSDTPIENYDPDFINGVLVGAWPQVFAMIQDIRKKQEIPFN